MTAPLSGSDRPRRSGRPGRRRTRPTGPETTWAACSTLLDYPTPHLLSALPTIEAHVPDDSPLKDLVAHLRTHDLRALQEEYVETFDHTRKCALYLTYYAYGDTRRRGAALVQFKQVYRAAGAVWDDTCGELPDHLCAVLQFGATVDVDAARRLLNDHRAGLEMLRLALANWRRHDGTVGSPWHAAVRAVCDTLAPLAGEDTEAVRRLIGQGPPGEQVGLGGYGTDPTLDPRLYDRPGAAFAAGRGGSGPALISGSTIPVGAPR